MKRKLRVEQAFTLVELLASMAVLVLIVLMMTRVLSSATRAWTTSSQKTNIDSQGRSALKLISQDFSTGITDDIMPLWIENDFYPAGGITAKWISQTNSATMFISFVALDANSSRHWREVSYFMSTNLLGRGVLFRREYTANISITQYYNGALDNASKLLQYMKNNRTGGLDDGGASTLYTSMVADNLFAFKVRYYYFDADDNLIEMNDKSPYHYDSREHEDRVPALLEVELKILDESQWQKTNYLTSASAWRAYAEAHATVFSETVSMPLCDKL